MITRKFGKDFDSLGGALTLSTCYFGKNKSGWEIKGEIHQDYYEWINDFTATHPKYGKVWGNFESEVKATSKAAFDHFYKHHAPTAWDYGDI